MCRIVKLLVKVNVMYRIERYKELFEKRNLIFYNFRKRQTLIYFIQFLQKKFESLEINT